MLLLLLRRVKNKLVSLACAMLYASWYVVSTSTQPCTKHTVLTSSTANLPVLPLHDELRLDGGRRVESKNLQYWMGLYVA